MKRISEKELDLYPLVALVGRVNVGKSTLFNRLIEQQKAVTAPVPGTTRDINYGFCDWRGIRFVVADTGGFVERPESEIEKKVFEQVIAILKKAHIILFVADAKVGLNPEDVAFLKLVRKKTRAPIMFVANKADKASDIRQTSEKEWLKTGLGAPLPVSAASGLGVGDLLDVLIERLPNKIDRPDAAGESEIRIAIIGRPNVGKSSLLNKILGEERVIVSPIAHTTREPQDMVITYQGRRIRIIDTVGIRKKSKVASQIEREGVIRSIANIKKADVVLLVEEAIVTAAKQERRLASLAEEAGVGIMILVNKWDLVEGKGPKSVNAFTEYFRKYFSFISWAPVLYISALSGQRVHKVLDAALSVQEARERTIDPSELEVFLKKAITKQKPSWLRGHKRPTIYGFEQRSSCPPTFALLVKDRSSISYAYLRYLENRLREQYDFAGAPVRIHTEEKITKKKAESL